MEEIQLFNLGTFTICAHHLVILTGLILCLFLTVKRAQKAEITTKCLAIFVPASVLLGFFFAHLGYCLVRLDYALYDMPRGSFLMFWDGNYMLYGGMLGIAAAAWLAAAVSRTSCMRLMDAAAPYGALFIAFVRLAEGLAGQDYGEYLTNDTSIFARFPFAVFDPYYEMWAWALFMASCAAALVVFVAVLKFGSGEQGDRTLLMLGLYASAQVVLESLRRDDFLRWGFVRVSQLISALVILFVLVMYCCRTMKAERRREIPVFAVFSLMVVFVILLEFATEGRIPFLRFLNPAGCYVCIAAASCVLAGCTWTMRRISFKAA